MGKNTEEKLMITAMDDEDENEEICNRMLELGEY